MNFIAATVELRSHSSGTVAAYGLEYCSADAVVPGTGSNAEVKLRLLCYNRAGAKLTTFKEWKEGTRALVTGNLVFSDDPAEPLDLLVSTLECNVPQDMYCNQVVLGNAFFGSDEIKERKNKALAVKIGTSLDNSDTVTWLFMETHESRKAKLDDRIRKGRPICVSALERSVSELNVVQRQARQRAATLKWTQYLTTEGLTWAQGMRDKELVRKYKAHWALAQSKKRR